MTPTRAKRNSKAPNRFSSGVRNEEPTSTDSSQDNITIMNQNSIPPPPLGNGKSAKFKPLLREPLKVKLPKLKRPHSQSTKEQPNKVNIDNIKIHKIKLPSFSAKKSRSKHSEKNSDKDRLIDDEVSSTARQDTESLLASPKVKNTTPKPNKNQQSKDSSLDDSYNSMDDIDKSPSRFEANLSATSKSSASHKMSSNDSSFSSIDKSSRMEIIVSKPESSEGSGIKCPCGVDDDLGVMVECEQCSTWQHGHCINVGKEEDAYEGYICAYCCLSQSEAHKSLYQLTLNDKFLTRFNRLESQRKQTEDDGDSGRDVDRIKVENVESFSLEELKQSIDDLQRVMNSFRVKWHLLTSQAYEAELRIWQNPVWSSEPIENKEAHNNIYFIDRCKNNLRLNLRNMLRSMDKRCDLIRYSVRVLKSRQSQIESHCNDSDTCNLNDISCKLDTISNELVQFGEKFKNLSTTS